MESVPSSCLSPEQVADIVEIEQLLARYAAAMTRLDIDTVQTLFTADGIYSAFGDDYTIDEFPELADAAPKGLFMTGTPDVHVDGDQATDYQTLLFIDQVTHYPRLAYWTDNLVRTSDGWRIKSRSVTFLRRDGQRNSGIAHDSRRPRPASARV